MVHGGVESSWGHAAGIDGELELVELVTAGLVVLGKEESVSEEKTTGQVRLQD